MHYCLNIIDTSSVLYAGHLSKARNSKYDTLAGNPSIEGLPIGGVRYALQILVDILSKGDDCIFVFDSPTDKNKFYQDYKGNRTRDPAIHVQQLMLLDIIKGSKIPYLKVDNFEADDLVASIMNKYRGKYMQYQIYTGDADLAANIQDDHTTVVGVASIYPTINSYNFETAVKSGARVPYNCILPYFAIYGKPSNNVKPFSTAHVNNSLWLSYLNYIKNTTALPGLGSTVSYFAAWLLRALETKEFESSLIEELYGRISYVFPREFESVPDFEFNGFDGLDLKKFAFFLKALNLDYLLPQIHELSTMSVPKSKEMLNYLASYKQLYNTGVLAVDGDMSPDASYFSTSDSELSKATQFFVDGDDF